MKTKIIYGLVITLILVSSSILASRPVPNAENQYYIFGDNTDAIPMLSFNWSSNETYVYPFNESLFYINETGVSVDLANVTGGGVCDPDGYAGDMGHPHDQDLNTTSNVQFNLLTATIIDTGQGYNELYAMNQDVDSGASVIFDTVDTGHGAYELYAMNQNVATNSNVQFLTVDTGKFFSAKSFKSECSPFATTSINSFINCSDVFLFSIFSFLPTTSLSDTI